MANTMSANRTVVGLFESMDKASRAAEELRADGIRNDQVSIIAGNESGRYSGYVDRDATAKEAANRASTGAAIGGGLGLIAGLVAVAVPGFGPVIAAGPVLAALTGAAAGAATGGLIGGLTAEGVTESDARLYEDRLRRGGVLVTVRTSDDLSNRVADILDRNGARDVDEEPPVVREDKTGGRGVRVYPEMLQRPAELQAFREGTIELRDEDFRRDYETRYRSGGKPYDYYSPGYQFGSQYGGQARYRNHDWNTVEPELRRDWEGRCRGKWEEFRDSIRYGWDRIRGRR